jgi:UDP-N-acetylglucosamine 2-epimerase
MFKIMTIVGTRPEIIRLSRVIPKLDQFFNHTLVHTGQNFDYELNEIFFDELDLRKPDFFLSAAKDSPADTIASIISSSDALMAEVKPNAILILGDTNSSLSSIAAKRRKIPIFHMEAGNRCFDSRVPEEINRKIVDHISDINLTYSEIAKQHLIREGLPPHQIIKTGSPLREVINFYQDKIDKSDVLKRMALLPNQYFLFSFHREENVDEPENLKKILSTIDALISQYNVPVIVSTHPRTRKRIESLNISKHEKIIFNKPFGFIDYINLQVHSKAVLSDSGTITEESSILNFPALNIRETNERQEGFEEGAVMMVGLDKDRIMSALKILEMQLRGSQRNIELVEDYSSINVSDKVVRAILSYTEYVNANTWKK